MRASSPCEKKTFLWDPGHGAPAASFQSWFPHARLQRGVQNRHLLCLVNRAHRVEKPTGRKGVEYVTTSDNTVV